MINSEYLMDANLYWCVSILHPIKLKIVQNIDKIAFLRLFAFLHRDLYEVKLSWLSSRKE